jgi:hypothetical protein
MSPNGDNSATSDHRVVTAPTSGSRHRVVVPGSACHIFGQAMEQRTGRSEPARWPILTMDRSPSAVLASVFAAHDGPSGAKVCAQLQIGWAALGWSGCEHYLSAACGRRVAQSAPGRPGGGARAARSRRRRASRGRPSAGRPGRWPFAVAGRARTADPARRWLLLGDDVHDGQHPAGLRPRLEPDG